MRKTWHIYAALNSGAYLGSVIAETEEEAIELGEDLAVDADIGLCSQCESRIDRPEIDSLIAEAETEAEVVILGTPKWTPHPLPHKETFPERSKIRKDEKK